MATSEDLQHMAGFWDIMLKRTVFLTATAGDDMVNILHDLFGVRRDTFLEFDGLIKSTDQTACR